MKAATPDSSFIIRNYLDGDEIKINEMFNEVFHQSRDLSHWLWKYRDNPYGSHVISLAETPDGTLAAHYAGTPVRIYSRLQLSTIPAEFTVYHIGDKMTRKPFRGIGRGKSSVLAKTVEQFCSAYCRGRVPFYFGFLTHHSLRFGILFLDYKTVEPVPFRLLRMEELRTTGKRRLKHLISGVKVCETREMDERWTDFFSEAAPHYGFLVKRDYPYLRWRYLLRPDRNYLFLTVMRRGRVAGWSVFHRDGNRIIWGDALFLPHHRALAECLFDYLKSHPIAEGAESIEGWFPSRPRWSDEVIEALGFRLTKEPNDLQFTIVDFTDRDVNGDLQEHFYYTMGDSDLF